jgi:ubiquinone/menaquinone biosynthesis C-methylase UbiE
METVKDYYDKRAPEYDDAYLGIGFYADHKRPGFDEELRTLQRMISEFPPCRILDVACGTGFLTQHLKGEVVGLDQSEAMLKIARERVPEATFVSGDAFALPFADGSFDTVFVANFYGLLLPHERTAFLSKVRRVAPKLVVVETTPRGWDSEGWQERTLSDGSQHRIYRRYFTADSLTTEIGGKRILFDGKWFVAVAA